MRIKIEVGKFYHVYNRGTEKRDIFNDDFDRYRFLTLLFLANGSKPIELFDNKPPVSEIAFSHDRGDKFCEIVAYCLMNNHIHLIIKEIKKGGIGNFMMKLCIAYTNYFNRANNRSGALFQGRYKRKELKGSEDLFRTQLYVHSNPFQKQQDFMRSDLMKYKWSSLLDYLGVERPERSIIDKGFFELTISDPQYLIGSIETYLSMRSDLMEEKII